MAATWQVVELLSGQPNVASSSTQSPWMDFTAAYEGYIVASAVNHLSAAPSTGATITCDVSGFRGEVFTGGGGIVQSGSGAGAIFSYEFTGLEGCWARINFSGNLGSSVECRAIGQRLTGI